MLGPSAPLPSSYRSHLLSPVQVWSSCYEKAGSSDATLASGKAGMPFVSVTRLKPRSIRFLPTVVLHTFRSRRQLRGMQGFIGGYLATSGPGLAFWTITVWDDEQCMMAFRNTEAHKAAMPKLIGSCDEAAVAHWVTDSARPPSPAEASERLRHGRTSKVRYPSPAHAKGDTWPDCKVPMEGPRLRP